MLGVRNAHSVPWGKRALPEPTSALDASLPVQALHLSMRHQKRLSPLTLEGSGSGCLDIRTYVSLEKIIQNFLSKSSNDLIPQNSSPAWTGMREEALLEIDQGLA